jgi:MFS family permease
MLLTWVLGASIVVTTLMTATLLQKLYGYSARQALAATSFGTFFLIFGTAAAGAIVDRIGSGRFFTGASVLFAATTFAFYTYAAVSVPVLLTLYALMGLAVGMVGAVPYVMVQVFPARVRFTGVSFSYNVAYAFCGGLTPLLVAALLPIYPMAHAYYLLGIAALTFGLGLHLLARGEGIEARVGIEEKSGD